MKNNKVIFVLNMVSPSVAAIFKLRYCVLMKHEKNIENIYSNSVFNSSLKSQPEMAPPYLRKIYRIPSSQLIKSGHIFNLVCPKTDISNCLNSHLEYIILQLGGPVILVHLKQSSWINDANRGFHSNVFWVQSHHWAP